MNNEAETTKGRVVRVTTKSLGGGSPMEQLFDVAIDDDAKAVEAVKTRISHLDEDVAVVGVLSENAVTGCDLTANEVKQRL